MNNIQETNSGAHRGAVRKWKRYICEVSSDITEKDVADYCRYFGLDIALEFTGEILHMFEAEGGVKA